MQLNLRQLIHAKYKFSAYNDIKARFWEEIMSESVDARSIFISYARKDSREIAGRLRDDLQAAGHRVWLDTTEIGGGHNWSRDIERAIEQCDIALALLSEGCDGYLSHPRRILLSNHAKIARI
jgi:hypothetical protein